jgi:predicted RNA-binding protein (virulence factor B family)
MALETGIYHSLKVEREAAFGYFLSDGYEDVLLHESELAGQTPVVGEMLTVFLYNDQKGRAAATLERPLLELDEVALLEVMDYTPRMGFFLENGISKQLLLPITELPEERVTWPKSNAGDLLLVKMTHDKQGRMLGALVRDEEQIAEFIAKREQLDLPDNRKDFHNGIVIKKLSAGAQVYLTEYNQIGFLHDSEQTRPIRLGEKVFVRMSYTREDGRLNLSMRAVKEISQLADAELILKVLNERSGAMPYSDKTPPDIIQKKFNLSKAAFKRALGKLMKDNVIYQEDGWTYLVERK